MPLRGSRRMPAVSGLKKFKIVWAVDPLGEIKSFQASAASLLEMIAGRLDAEVFPIYLYGGYPGKEISGLRELEILVKPYLTLREGVDL